MTIRIIEYKLNRLDVKHYYSYLGNCENKNLAGCSFYGQSVGCNNIESASSMLQMSLQEICQQPVSQFSCDGTGIIKDYCPKTCLGCGKNITRYVSWPDFLNCTLFGLSRC